jgi:hypothetical protein
VTIRLGFAGAAALLFAAATPAAGQQMQSSYTDLDLTLCTVTKSDDFGSTWACPGYRGIPVMVSEGDLRFFVSYGLNAPHEPVVEQTLPPFNTLGPRIEWRVSNASGSWTPVATILRYRVARAAGEGEGEVLVVTQLGEGTTCHVAYIDAKANADANELARAAADELAGDFDCAQQPEIRGAFEAWER